MARRKKQNDEEPKENQDNINSESDDTFGLPDVEYQPLKRDEHAQEPPKEEPVEEPISQEPSASVPDEPVTEDYSWKGPAPEETVPESHEERTEDTDDVHEAAAGIESRLPHYDERQHEDIHEEIVEDESHDYRPSYSYMEEEKSIWPKVLGFLLILVIAGGLLWYFAHYQPKQEAEAAEKARREALVRQEEARKRQEADRLAELRRQEEQRRLDSLASIPKVGTFETLSGRTGRYYVIVASGIDDDLLTDYAQKLIKAGRSCMLIPPFGRTKFSRLAIDVKDTYADAQSTADGLKGGDFGDQVWVVRY